MSSKKKMLWAISFIGFFLSKVIDNLTTTLVMVTMIQKLIDSREDRLLVRGGLGMYSLEVYPTDHTFWNMIAYCTGIGGSILIVGFAA